MCGIAGIIYRDGTQHPIGDEMTRMLQSMKHRGPDSTGYALYGSPEREPVLTERQLERGALERPAPVVGGRVHPRLPLEELESVELRGECAQRGLAGRLERRNHS